MDTTISSVSNNKWLIRVERKLNGHSASGQVVVIQNSEPQAGNPPHVVFVGARAWLALAQARREADDVEGAIASARAGIEELGRRYYSTSLRVKDDTSLHIDLAEELIEQGRQAEAARTLIQALETRLQMYAQLHADTIAE